MTSGLDFVFDRAKFDAILDRPAKHKQCFGAARVERGNVISLMLNSIRAYDDYLEEGAGALQTVAVLYRGAAIALALGDDSWNALLVPLVRHMPEMAREMPEAQPGKGNPYLSGLLPSAIRQGASFFVCHNAIVSISSAIGEALNKPVKQIHAAIMADIVHGAIVVPAGVMAINACQEKHFTYIQSSL